MPNTTKGLPYPNATDPVSSGAANIQALATAVDVRLTPVPSATPPAGPVEGQLWALPFDVAAGIVWLFRYNASGSTYKWEFVGGAAVLVKATDTLGVAANTWVSYLPAFAAPRTGEYIVTTNTEQLACQGAGTLSHGPGISGVSSSPLAASQASGALNQNLGLASVSYRMTLTAGQSAIILVYGGAGGATLAVRSLTATPVRVS